MADSAIVLPPRLHLDTNHVIEIVHLRRGRSRQSGERQAAYQRVSDAIISGRCTVLFNPAAPLEWVEGAGPEEPWKEFSEFFETAQSVVEVDVGLAYVLELLHEAKRVAPQLKVPLVPVLRPVLEISQEMIDFSKYHPGFADQRYTELVRTVQCVPKNRGVREWILGSIRFARQYPESMRERIEGWKAAMEANLTSIKARQLRVNNEVFLEWAQRSTRADEVLQKANPQADLEPVWARMFMENCPLSRAYLKALPPYLADLSRTGQAPDANDSDDWIAVPAALLADYALIEKRMRHYLVTGSPELGSRVFRSPEEMLKMVEL